MRIKGVDYTRTQFKNNILKWYNHDFIEAYDEWYPKARNSCDLIQMKIEFKYPRIIIVGVVAALSPLKSWSQNLIQAEKMLLTGDCGHMKAMKAKAAKIMELDYGEYKYEDMKVAIMDILNGNKTSAFFMNILEPNNTNMVTIDRHAISIALGHKASPKEQSLTKNQYEFFAQCYIWTAESLGITASRLQSVTWSNYRGTAE